MASQNEGNYFTLWQGKAMSHESALALASGNSSPEPVAPAQEASIQGSPQLQSTPFNHLAKKEAEFVRKTQEFKKEQDTWGQERARLADAKKQYDQYNELKKTDPVAALKMLGFSETDIFNYMANAQPPELSTEQKAIQAAEAAADAKIKAFEDNQTQKQVQARQAQDQNLIQGFKSELNQTIAKNAEKFEYCNYYGPEAEALAYEITLAVVNDSKGADIITAQEAVQMAEEYFEERDKEMNKLKKRNPTPPSAEPKVEPTRTRTVSPPQASVGEGPPKPAITKTRTLTNGISSTIASTRHRMNETKEQKRERLIQALANGVKP